MQIHNAVSEQDMVAAFLRAEIDSPRWRCDVQAALAAAGRSRSLIDCPDLANPADNAARARLLGDYRGFRRNSSLFAGFPPAVHWQRAELESSDLQRIRVLNQSPWVCYSGGSRLACDAAAFLASDRSRDDVKKDIAAVCRDLRAGHTIPEVIVVGTSLDTLVILEGHVRVMAGLGLNCGYPLPALVGTAPGISEWRFY